MQVAAYYESLAEELLSRLRRIGAFVNNRPASGYWHEEILRDILRDLLSPRFALRTGFVADGRDEVSRQCDILVVDENDPAPYLFKKGNFVVAQPQSVAAAIEVKTFLNKGTFHEATENAASLNKVFARNLSHLPGTLLFAFESTAFTQETLDGWYKDAPVGHGVTSYATMMFALDSGIIMKDTSDDVNRMGHFVVHERSEQTPRARALSVFLMTIRKHAEMKAGVFDNPYRHAVVEGFYGLPGRYRLGEGWNANTAGFSDAP